MDTDLSIYYSPGVPSGTQDFIANFARALSPSTVLRLDPRSEVDQIKIVLLVARSGLPEIGYSRIYSLSEIYRMSGDRSFATYIRRHMAEGVGGFIQNEVLDSLNPPPDFVDAGVEFRGDTLYFKTTGSREKDRERLVSFNSYMRETQQTTLRNMVIADLL